MDQPVTEVGGEAAARGAEAAAWGAEAAGDTEGEWLADNASPLLEVAAARLEDPRRPDRLAWNTFRTLAQWDTDAWVPSLLEVALGNGNPLSALEWAGASVVPWGAALDFTDLSDVVLDGNEGFVVLACTLLPHPTEEHLQAAALAALDRSVQGGRDAGLVVVAPPGSDGIPAELEVAGRIELHDGRTVGELLAGRVGWVSWPELGRLALDLAEESDPSHEEQVRRLVAELNGRFSDPNL